MTKKAKWKFAKASGVMVLYASTNLFLAYAMMKLVDAATAQNLKQVGIMILASAALNIADLLLGLLGYFLLYGYVREQLTQDKKNRFEYMIGHSSKDEIDISAFSTDIELLYGKRYFNQVMLVYNVAQLLMAAAGIVLLSWKAAIVVVISIFLPMVVPSLFQERLQTATGEYKDSMNQYLNFVKDAMQGTQEIRMYGIFGFFRKKHNELNESTEKRRVKMGVMTCANALTSGTVGGFTFLMVMAICGYLVAKGEVTIGVMIAITQLMNSVAGPVGTIASEIGEISSTKEVAKQYQHVEAVSRTAAEGRKPVKKIDVSNLTFAYNEGETILQNVSLSFEHGKKYAIVGESGSGKSTLAKVLAGLNPGFDGKITMTNADGSDVKLPCENSNIQYVSQEPYLFELSAADNVYFGEPESGEQMQNRMDRLGIRKLFTDTASTLANRDSISGGQKQRLVIARALYHNPDVLILDEPTANLDRQNTLQTMKYITEAKCGILIVITHNTDQEFLKNFDEIVRIEKGKIAV